MRARPCSLIWRENGRENGPPSSGSRAAVVGGGRRPRCRRLRASRWHDAPGVSSVGGYLIPPDSLSSFVIILHARYARTTTIHLTPPSIGIPTLPPRYDSPSLSLSILNFPYETTESYCIYIFNCSLLGRRRKEHVWWKKWWKEGEDGFALFANR